MVASVETLGKEIRPVQSTLEGENVRNAWNVNYLSHGWHRYVGRFPPQIIRALLNAFRIEQGELVLDPFSGSGTTLVESRLLGIDSIGFDICPLSHLISQVKTSLDLEPNVLLSSWSRVQNRWKARSPSTLHRWDPAESGNDHSFSIPDFPNKEKWFGSDAFRQLIDFMSIVEQFVEPEVRKFFYVAMSASMRSIANVDVDVVRTEYRRTPRVNVDVSRIVSRKINRMINDLAIFRKLRLRRAKAVCKLGDARELGLENDSIDFIVTSPPYGIEAISYLRTHMLSYRVLYEVLKTDVKELSKRMIGTDFVMHRELRSNDLLSKEALGFFESFEPRSEPDRRRISQMVGYFQDMEKSILEMARVLKVNSHAVIVIGDKQLLGRKIPTHKILRQIAENSNLVQKSAMPVKLVCNNPTAVTPWSERMIRDEYILVFQKTNSS
jgi:DNA modification methylase